MNIRKMLAVAAVIVLATGCATAPQSPVSFNDSAYGDSKRIGLSFADAANPTLALPGADCLLCIAAASAANGKLSAHVKQFSTEDLNSLKFELEETLSESGKDVVVLEAPINWKKMKKTGSKDNSIAKYDFIDLGAEHGVDQFLIVEFRQVGATRPYASYVPTGDPTIYIEAHVYLVDAKTNTYHWYAPIQERQAAEGEWKEPPNYPALTNAYYQVVERVRDRMLEPFSSDTGDFTAERD